MRGDAVRPVFAESRPFSSLQPPPRRCRSPGMRSAACSGEDDGTASRCRCARSHCGEPREFGADAARPCPTPPSVPADAAGLGPFFASKTFARHPRRRRLTRHSSNRRSGSAEAFASRASRSASSDFNSAMPRCPPSLFVEKIRATTRVRTDSRIEQMISRRIASADTVVCGSVRMRADSRVRLRHAASRRAGLFRAR